jgi:uncharacterized protein (TIGR03083 family)
MATATQMWPMIHSERASLADTLDGLDSEQWASPSLCAGWSVQLTAAHVLAGAEQTGFGFIKGLASSAFRFNVMMDKDAHRLGALVPRVIVDRLRARTTTTNHPPAPIAAMLAEVVVHGADIRQPLGLPDESSMEAVVAGLNMFKAASFPVAGKKYVEGLHLVATDTEWSHGTGPEVTGPALSLLLAMTGRGSGINALGGSGVGELRNRIA